MLEKIGLSSKPSLRGNNWVADGSHCQGRSSHFTFIYRKHHCRRCGGLFCGSCTQQRMVLRGQGDSPVRICDPCKKLEEAARFEIRYGHKNRSGKGSSKLTTKNEEEVINQILGNEGNVFSSSTHSSSMGMLADTHQSSSDGSCSSTGEVDTGRHILKTMSPDQQHLANTANATPDELRQQAIEKKKKYKTLKAEGQSEDALRAFKTGKELERQAASLELYLRKNRKKALASPKEDSKISPEKSEGNDDLASELKELGWSDMDLRDAEKRPATLSFESELSTLVGEVSQKSSSGKTTHGPDKSQVIAHKRAALELKLAGNLVEAKEELKRAKLLEKEIEEREFLGESDDSDDELSLLMRSINNVKDDAFSVELKTNSAFDIDMLGASDNFGIDSNFEVTDEDMEDPEIAAALTSLGWTEETQPVVAQNSSTSQPIENRPVVGIMGRNADETKYKGPKTEGKSKIMIQKELIALKKKAYALKKEGKMDEAEEELNRGKILEKQLEELDKPSKPSQLNASKTFDPEGESDVTDQDLHDPSYLSLLQNLGWKDDDNQTLPTTEEVKRSTDTSDAYSGMSGTSNISRGVSRRSKGEIQSELLGLKRKAFSLRRQGQVEEAEEVLKNASVLEAQLAEIGTPCQNEVLSVLASETKVDENTVASFNVANLPVDSFSEIKPMENYGRRDNAVPQNVQETTSGVDKSFGIAVNSTPATMSQNDPRSLQQEIMAHKRNALKLKREGKLAEAKEELAQAKLLEKNLGKKSQTSTTSSDVPDSKISSSERNDKTSNLGQKCLPEEKSVNIGQKPLPEENISKPSQKPLSSRDRFKLQQESLSHKRQALKLRKEGRTEEAEAEIELAKALEAQLEESAGHGSVTSSTSSTVNRIDDVSVESFLDPELLSALKAIGIQDASSDSQDAQGHVSKESVVSKGDISAEERVYLEGRIKAEKLKAVQLKRSGRQAEAMDALRRAKLHEKKLNDLPLI